MTNTTIAEARNYIKTELKELYPERELQSLIKIILSQTSKIPSTTILAYPETKLEVDVWHKISKICSDLKKFRPIQYIIGTTEFYGLTLELNKHTLIPRQETEELVDLIIKENNHTEPVILDIGTGSGAIAVSLSKNISKSIVTGTDISDSALEIARSNALSLDCNIKFLKDDILNTKLRHKSHFDIIVSNPPYVRELERREMNKNVLDYEPESALFVSDNDPLIFYRAIAEVSWAMLKKEGRIYCEINEALGKETAQLFKNYHYSDIRIIKDINNKDRIISATKEYANK